MTASPRICIIGGGPAGLAAAEYLAEAGCAVQILDAMPSFGRKFLMAGRGGLNITHSEAWPTFRDRYGPASAWLRPALEAWTAQDIRDWMTGLGQESFVGSSGRVFPTAMKASPLLRAWLARLRDLGVTFTPRARWTGWNDQGQAVFTHEPPMPNGVAGTGGEAGQDSFCVQADAFVLALGGASWPRLGSNGGWVNELTRRGIAIAPLQPANCGFRVGWSDVFAQRFAGTPLKPVALSFEGVRVRGEVTITQGGLEGGALYALSTALRQRAGEHGRAVVLCDLRPDMTQADIIHRLAQVRARESLANRLRKALRLPPVAVGLLREAGPIPAESATLAARIKTLPVVLDGPQPLARAISTAGGITQDACTEQFMLRALPGVFVAGEMLDWEAPTGGYLLHACLATGRAAARGVLDWLHGQGARRYPPQP
ncbi:TIGR03862 family flavoprotein [Acetobacter sp. TBRC 12305]|uniref:TIGR03862 family flavoprotein n=1 Tax=Acetobacter garciniae TaxID=2817435 RepID=A0A939HPI8_9PROT|nr:TIGR03862 family flavoprotein [Acetobacter garciniae]MBO1324949.1 TIGR03862 family flavoprotein [Acetobacter garciniae]MBX0344640.1 TIGR03862 family flavoprotein [Acetobacter garciniae]